MKKEKESHLTTTDYPRRSGEAGLPSHKLRTGCDTTSSPSPLGLSHPSPSGRPLLDEQPVPAKAELPQGRRVWTGAGAGLGRAKRIGPPKEITPFQGMPPFEAIGAGADAGAGAVVGFGGCWSRKKTRGEL